jgi:hypothetical protein
MQFPDFFLQIGQVLLVPRAQHRLGLFFALSLAVLGDEDVVLLEVGDLCEEFVVGLLDLEVLLVEYFYLGALLLDLLVPVLDLVIQLLRLVDTVLVLLGQGIFLSHQLVVLSHLQGVLLVQVSHLLFEGVELFPFLDEL